MTRSSLTPHLALAALTVLAVVPCLGEGAMFFDLGELVYFSDAMLERRVPGRDYVVNAYGPGRYLVLAGLWEFFGRSFSVIWGLFLALRLAITACSWELSRRLLKGPAAYLPVLLLILAPGPLHKGFFLLGTLVLALAFVLRVERDRWDASQTWLGLGVVIGFVALFRLDLGGFGGLTALFVLYATRSPLRMVVPLAFPLALGLTATWALLHSLGGDVFAAVVAQVGDDIFKNQTIKYPRMPGFTELLAFESWKPYLLWLPLPVYLVNIGILSRRWGRDSFGRLPSSSLALACVTILGIFSCNQVRMKPEFGHLLQAGPLLWVCLAVVLSWMSRRAGLLGRGLALGLSTLLVASLVVTFVTVERANIYTGSFTIPWERHSTIDTPLGPLDFNVEEYQELAPMLETVAAFPPGPIWVPTNQPLYFALTGRPDPTGHVGTIYYANNSSRQIEIIARLEQSRPRLAVFVDDSIEGPERRLANAAPQLYSYLMTNYAPLVTYGRNQVMKRRGMQGLTPPSSAPE